MTSSRAARGMAGARFCVVYREWVQVIPTSIEAPVPGWNLNRNVGCTVGCTLIRFHSKLIPSRLEVDTFYTQCRACHNSDLRGDLSNNLANDLVVTGMLK
jgi:hypothetical protein